jgi:hypothetical protein
MTMTIRTMTVVCGLLMAGAAAADDQTLLTGNKITLDNVSGVVECTGGCVVKFSHQPAIKSVQTNKREIAVDSAETNAKGEVTAFNLRMVVSGMRYESEAAVFRTAEDGVMELKAEKIRMIKVPATL